ncbi:MAG TPA: hypothetical protein VNI20_09705, partial [Fimbriimonadaceae bacterium]|nr:hypothetical protein [Fimbriimonadaceae bacterium]
MKVPREIDELMWEVADDNGNEVLLEQFRSRYPEFECELDKRIQMVVDLKGSRPSKMPEQFRPSNEVRNFGPSRLAVVGVTTLVLCSLTFAAYALVQYQNARHIEEPLIPPSVIFTPPSYVDGPTAQNEQQDPPNAEQEQ